MEQKIKKIIDNVLNIIINPDSINEKTNDFNTSFTYPLKSDKQRKIVKQGIEDLKNTLPITLSFQNGKIEIVEITYYNKHYMVYFQIYHIF